MHQVGHWLRLYKDIRSAKQKKKNCTKKLVGFTQHDHTWVTLNIRWIVWIIFKHSFICLTENIPCVHYKKKTTPRCCWIRKLLLFVLRNTLTENAEFFGTLKPMANTVTALRNGQSSLFPRHQFITNRIFQTSKHCSNYKGRSWKCQHRYRFWSVKCTRKVISVYSNLLYIKKKKKHSSPK